MLNKKIAFLGIISVFGVLVVSFGAQAQGKKKGQLDCAIEENGATAFGVMVVRRDGKEIATSSCGKAILLEKGHYEAAVRLDGALDLPEKAHPVTIRPGGQELVRATFQTGTLEVHAIQGGRKAAALATIFQEGHRVGTLGMGVTGRLSAGTYMVVVRYRGEEKTFNAVAIASQERRVLNAEF